MLSKFFPGKKILYLNDRHEEADTGGEDRRMLYDQRILPLLSEGDFAIFAERLDPFLRDYYRSLGLGTIEDGNIFYEPYCFDYPSLTQAVLHDKPLLKEIKKKNISLLVPYIESHNTEALSQETDVPLGRRADITELMNNKSNYRQIAIELNVPVVSGLTTNKKNVAADFYKIKSRGFNKIVIKRVRSVAGFGVFVVDSPAALNDCLKNNFTAEESFVLEGLIEDITFRPNTQYFISHDEIIFLVSTNQIVEQDNMSYGGNIFTPKPAWSSGVQESIESFSFKLCRYLQKQKCYGFVGFDWIVTRENEVYTTEANVRFNASTFPALLARQFFGERPDVCWLFKTFSVHPILFEKFFDFFGDFTKRRGATGVLPIGIDLLGTLGEGQFMIMGYNLAEVKHFWKKFDKFYS